jgi:hypothetical protein
LVHTPRKRARAEAAEDREDALTERGQVKHGRTVAFRRRRRSAIAGGGAVH